MMIPGFEILEKLGEGGTASVWKAKQNSLNRVVAIKLLTRQKIDDPEMAARFRLEAESTASLNHPGIVQIHDMGEFDQFAFLVMEYVEGESLDERLTREGSISPDAALDIASQVAQAMAYAWEKTRLVHCDLKPGNILIDAEGQAKVSDLGVSRMLGGASEQVDSDMITGTPYYISPEQAAAGELDARSDIYSLGATLYQAVTGQLPFGDQSAERALASQGRKQIPDPLDVNPKVPANFVWLLEKMMMVNPKHRPATWEELADDISQVRQGRAPEGLQEDAGLSTIERSDQRPPPKKKEIRIQARGPAKPVRVTAAATPAARKFAVQEDRLRPAVQHLFMAGVLAVIVYGVVFFMSKQERPERTVSLVPEEEASFVRAATAEEVNRRKGVAAEPEKPVEVEGPTPEELLAQWSVLAAYEEALKQIDASRAEYKRFTQDQDQARLDEVERLARQGLDVLEGLREGAPDVANVGEKIRLGYQSISNARQSRKLDLGVIPGGGPTMPEERSGAIDELFKASEARKPAAQKKDVPPVVIPEFEPEPITLSDTWNDPAAPTGAASEDLVRVLQAYGEPRADLNGPSAMPFPKGVTYRMPINIASTLLRAQPAGRKALHNTAMPQKSLVGYLYDGSFGGGFDRCMLIIDRKGQVVAAQIIKSQPALVPSLPRNLYLDSWKIADLITGDPVTASGIKIAHRVRRVDGGAVIESESATADRLQPTYTSRTYLPQPLIDLLLLRNLPEE